MHGTRYRAYCEDQLLACVDLFVAYGAAPRDQEKVDAIARRTEAVEQALWAQIVAAAGDRPTPVNATSMLDLQASMRSGTP